RKLSIDADLVEQRGAALSMRRLDSSWPRAKTGLDLKMVLHRLLTQRIMGNAEPCPGRNDRRSCEREFESRSLLFLDELDFINCGTQLIRLGSEQPMKDLLSDFFLEFWF